MAKPMRTVYKNYLVIEIAQKNGRWHKKAIPGIGLQTGELVLYGKQGDQRFGRILSVDASGRCEISPLLFFLAKKLHLDLSKTTIVTSWGSAAGGLRKIGFHIRHSLEIYLSGNKVVGVEPDVWQYVKKITGDQDA